jgi:uncharacterized protein with FMN-binding domain
MMAAVSIINFKKRKQSAKTAKEDGLLLFLSLMKKLTFSIFVTVFYVMYIIYDRNHTPGLNAAITVPAPNLSSSQQTVNTSGIGSADPPLATTALPVPQPQLSPSAAPTPAAPTPTPSPAPAPAPQPQGQYKNGQYIGSSADAFYGFVQVKAVISGGKIVDVQFLSYPSDRSTSRQINSQAMPYLIQEAIAAQSANVDIISGATDTSQAFIQSLASALAQAI